jgi:hypothetical protein
MLRDPTLLRWASPAAVALAAFAGGVTLAREIHVRVYDVAYALVSDVEIALFIAKTFGVTALAIAVLVFLPRALLGAVHRADRLAEADVRESRPRKRRFLRGMWTALVALPLTFVAVLYSTPVVALVWRLVRG